MVVGSSPIRPTSFNKGTLMNNIAECPECGLPIDGDEVQMVDYKHFVECFDCGYSGSKSDTFIDAVRSWNEQAKLKYCSE